MNQENKAKKIRKIKEIQKSPRSMHDVFVSYIIRIIIGIALILTIFSIMPSATTVWDKLIAGSGVIAIVIGLAAQTALGNVFCGFMLMANRPYEIGDRVEIGEDTGYIEGMTLQYTILRTYLNEIIMIPNSVVNGERIKNYSKIVGASYPIEVSVAYGTDLDKAKEIMQNIIFSHQRHYGAKPTVLVKEAGDYGILLKAIVTTKDPDENVVVCSDCLQGIIQAFEENDIVIPYPTHVMYKK